MDDWPDEIVAVLLTELLDKELGFLEVVVVCCDVVVFVVRCDFGLLTVVVVGCDVGSLVVVVSSSSSSSSASNSFAHVPTVSRSSASTVGSGSSTFR